MQALYGSVPMMLAHDEGKSTAIFWLNASETWIDVTDGSNGLYISLSLSLSLSL
jgi:alpha-glucosidase (family GH31 glycosyl hydrolase)